LKHLHYSLFFVALWSAAGAASVPHWGGELRFCVRADPKTLDPLETADQPGQTVRYLTGGVLLRLNRSKTSATGPAARRTCSKRRWTRRTARSCGDVSVLLNAKSIGLTITLADITEEEFRVLELIEAERQEQIKAGDGAISRSR
jgi:hypothetical protein